MILVYGGVQADGADTTPPRLPASAVADVEKRVQRLLVCLRPRLVLGAAASGADLIVAGAARREDVPVRLLLPHERTTFRRTSVESRGAEWTDRYDRLVSELDGYLVEEAADDPDRDGVYQAHNLRMLDRAAELTEPGESVWCLVLRPAPGERRSVSDDLADRAEGRGVLLIDLDPTATPDRRRTAFVAMPYGRKFDPVTRRNVNCDVVFNRVYVPALEDLDIEWHRADLEADSGIIHVGMIEDLARSDLVIADMFGANANVAYELGLRHGLAHRATVITRPRLAEFNLSQGVPFDVVPSRYFGFARGLSGVTDDQAASAIRELRQILRNVLSGSETDSPVFNWFTVDATGGLVRRNELADTVAVETQVRSVTRAAIDSASADRMRAAVIEIDQAAIPEHARLGLRLQLAIALSNARAYADARPLFGRAEPPPTDPLRLLWLQQYALLLSWYGGERAEAGAGPDEAWDEAERLITEARTGFGDSEETCGIAAGIVKRRFTRALDDSAATAQAGAALRRMIGLYRSGFVAEPSYYAGLNLVAALRLDLQHFGGSPEGLLEIQEVLPVVSFFARREAEADSEVFWPAVTLAELALHSALLAPAPDPTEATARYASAAALPVPSAWRKSAADQLRLFQKCGDDGAVIDPLLAILDG